MLTIKDGAYYRLGGKVEDVVAGHIITEAYPVYWCSVTQTWEDA